MRYLLIVSMCLSVLLACSCSGSSSDEPESEGRIIPFERVEVGSVETCFASIDQEANGDFICTIRANHARKLGGGSHPIRNFNVDIKATLRFKEDLSGSFSRWVDDEMVQEKLFTTEFFGCFGIFNDSGYPRASLESGENFVSLLLFDDHGQMRIKLQIDGLEESWIEAVPAMYFYDEDGIEIEI